jgi:hypothetical protein
MSILLGSACLCGNIFLFKFIYKNNDVNHGEMNFGHDGKIIILGVRKCEHERNNVLKIFHPHQNVYSFTTIDHALFHCHNFIQIHLNGLHLFPFNHP